MNWGRSAVLFCFCNCFTAHRSSQLKKKQKFHETATSVSIVSKLIRWWIFKSAKCNSQPFWFYSKNIFFEVANHSPFCPFFSFVTASLFKNETKLCISRAYSNFRSNLVPTNYLKRFVWFRFFKYVSNVCGYRSCVIC